MLDQFGDVLSLYRHHVCAASVLRVYYVCNVFNQFLVCGPEEAQVGGTLYNLIIFVNKL